MPENKFLDDIAKFGNTTLSAMSSMQRQVRKWAGEQVNVAIDNMDLVTKKEFEAYKLGISQLQERLSQLEEKLLEAEPSTQKPVKTKATKQKAK